MCNWYNTDPQTGFEKVENICLDAKLRKIQFLPVSLFFLMLYLLLVQ